MKQKNHFQKPSFFHVLRVGFFLAFRDIKRASLWTTILTVIIMTLTFLNLVVVSGILVGLIEGAVDAVQEKYLSDVYISTLKNENYIKYTPQIVSFTKSLPEVEAVSARYVEGGVIDSKYKEIKKASEKEEVINTSFVGVDVIAEDQVTNLRDSVVEGEYLSPGDFDEVLAGAMLFKKYLNFESDSFPVMDETVGVGSKIRIKINGNTRDVVIKGIVKTKVDEIDRRLVFTDSQFRSLINRFDYSVDEIAVKTKAGADPVIVRDTIKNAGFDEYAKIQTAEEGEPKFIKDMKKTFAILGNLISSIGLVVAAITIFIVIFINAITRRKYIGISKGIGIVNLAIEISYVFQSIFYAIFGVIIGMIFVFGFLKPYLDIHPINFPFSDGILVATYTGTAIRGLILFVATIIAGYLPARIIVKQNTLDAILGR